MLTWLTNDIRVFFCLINLSEYDHNLWSIYISRYHPLYVDLLNFYCCWRQDFKKENETFKVSDYTFGYNVNM